MEMFGGAAFGGKPPKIADKTKTSDQKPADKGTDTVASNGRDPMKGLPDVRA